MRGAINCDPTNNLMKSSLIGKCLTRLGVFSASPGNAVRVIQSDYRLET